MIRLVVALAALLALALPAGAHPPHAGAPWTNPVLARDFADPMVMRASDGWYYAYATQATHLPRPINVQVARSRDLKAWTFLGDAMPARPAWASATQDFWAPHVHEAGGKYYLYFSAAPNGAGDHFALGVAVATRPQGPFRPVGGPLTPADEFKNIDPFAFDDPATGKKLLYWGSGFGPIRVRELAADRLGWAPGSREQVVLAPDPARDYEHLIEGAWVVRRDGWYYLFYSGDDCCGGFDGLKPPHYAVLVARSRSATGPFTKRQDATGAPDSAILRAGAWEGPGHNAVVRDAEGRDWILYHAIDPARRWLPGTKMMNRPLLLDPLGWRDGWPFVGDGTPGGTP